MIRSLFDSHAVVRRFEISGHEVWTAYMPFSKDRQIIDLCGEVLSQAELERVGSITQPEERSRFMHRRAFQRYCAAVARASDEPLSRLGFARSGNGQPLLVDETGTSFSFSSCRTGMTGAWSSAGMIGIDIEDRDEIYQPVRLARKFFSASEARLIQKADVSERRSIFLKLWVLKEAALKSIGKGMPFGMDRFQFSLMPGLRMTAAPEEYGGASRFFADFPDLGPGFTSLVLHRRG
ncbi:MAG: 4'-phosphopantetheinyl transferase family protein [Rhizobiaceae bacterium]